jgi:hypothetical protein
MSNIIIFLFLLSKGSKGSKHSVSTALAQR